MTVGDTRDTTVKRERIKESVRNALWARTTGRCTICNRRLLGDSRTYLHSVLLAELAHNIGATDGDGSPRNKGKRRSRRHRGRGELVAPVSRLSQDHRRPRPHRLLPSREVARDQGVLRAARRDGDRERWTHPYCRTAPRQPDPRLSRPASQREVAETLLAVNYLGLDETQRSGDFTCRIHGAVGGRGFWHAAQQVIEDTLALVHQAIDTGGVEHISVFAIAPVPLLVYLSWHLDNKTPTRVFQKHRDQFVGWSWTDQGEPSSSRSVSRTTTRAHRCLTRTDVDLP